MSTESPSIQERLERTIRLRKSTGEAAILVGVFLLGLAAVIYSQLELPLQNPFGAGVGPRLFPQLAGGVMVIMSLYLLVLRLVGRWRGTTNQEILEMEVQDGLRVVVFTAMCLGYMALFESVGFLIATSVLLFLLFVVNGFKRYVLAAALAVGFTIAIYIMFNIALGLPLPAPILDGLFGGLL